MLNLESERDDRFFLFYTNDKDSRQVNKATNRIAREKKCITRQRDTIAMKGRRKKSTHKSMKSLFLLCIIKQKQENERLPGYYH